MPSNSKVCLLPSSISSISDAVYFDLISLPFIPGIIFKFYIVYVVTNICIKYQIYKLALNDRS